MDNSGYHKFPMYLDEDQARAKKAKRKSAVLVSVILIAASTVLLVAVVLAVGIGVGTAAPAIAQEPGLNLAINTPNELRGQYYDEDGIKGITFHSIVNDSYVHMQISAHDGELIVQMLHSIKMSMTIFDTDNKDFLVIEHTKGNNKIDLEEYFIHKNSTKLVESMMREERNMSDDMLEHMDSKTVNETRRVSLEKLAMSEEAALIIEAAKALGYNITLRTEAGSQYKAVKVFYMFALQLAKARASNDVVTPTTLPDHDKTGTGSHQHRAVRCPNGATCSSGQCPYRNEGNDCFGMCGPQCTCWSFICGDCCVHRYCETHDQCCADRGFFSFPCLSVAWRVLGSPCSSAYSC